jgi:hypothetical protein
VAEPAASPRAHASTRDEAPVARSAPQVVERAEPETPRVRDYETVNQMSGDKKKGWWKKLTG